MRDRANLFNLFKQLLGRELSSRYRATVLGAIWLVLQPLLMLSIYTLVFSGIFKVRWGGAETTASFALVLFAGLIVFTFFSEVLVSSPSLVSSQPNYVKKVVFPVEMLAVVRVAAAGVNAVIGLLILFVAQWVIDGAPSPWFALSLAVLSAFAPMLLGVSWGASALGVYMPDISQLAGLLASVMLFISPIFFPASAMPQGMSALVRFNPLVIPMEQLRKVTVQGVPPDAMVLVIYFAVSCLFAAVALWFFRRLSAGFSDVL
ncbi:ABC transporter permease [Thermomonas sp. HDW16]|uniref:ABC transporter permease n=1 Tax=Thermomonas sp. HDW16 TaxID=2714945 RepID=UPI00140CE664|nr:ABC transporter permease [Thermomonas sp. HDW16]QIL21518.1 ABC transporter permease [Thermomonas sp. HDW16]